MENFPLRCLKWIVLCCFFSFVGMKDKEIAIKKLEKEMKPLTVVMEEDEEELSEVVVTGMFNRRKEGLQDRLFP